MSAGSGMTRRILPRAEYDRLVGTYLEPLIAALPSDAEVVVIEDAEGTIVGCSSIFARDHIEGTWIAEGHRNAPGVFWSLLQGIKATARRRGTERILTASMDDRMTAFLTRMHAEPLPGVHFVWPVGRES
jgi:hypothetical protein